MDINSKISQSIESNYHTAICKKENLWFCKSLICCVVHCLATFLMPGPPWQILSKSWLLAPPLIQNCCYCEADGTKVVDHPLSRWGSKEWSELRCTSRLVSWEFHLKFNGFGFYFMYAIKYISKHYCLIPVKCHLPIGITKYFRPRYLKR